MSRVGKPLESVNDVLVDLLDDNLRRLKRLLENMHDDCVFWSLDRETNSIATTL